MALPKWFNADRQRNNRLSREQEKKWAKKEGGKRQAGSGSSWRAPQDVKTPDFLDQLKFTHSMVMSISVRQWKQLRADALRQGREPRMIVEFKGEKITLEIREAH